MEYKGDPTKPGTFAPIFNAGASAGKGRPGIHNAKWIFRADMWMHGRPYTPCCAPGREQHLTCFTLRSWMALDSDAVPRKAMTIVVSLHASSALESLFSSLRGEGRAI